MKNKEKLANIIRAARYSRTYCSSDGKPVHTCVLPLVDEELVEILADYLIDCGVTFEEPEEDDYEPITHFFQD